MIEFEMSREKTFDLVEGLIRVTDAYVNYYSHEKLSDPHNIDNSFKRVTFAHSYPREKVEFPMVVLRITNMSTTPQYIAVDFAEYLPNELEEQWMHVYDTTVQYEIVARELYETMHIADVIANMWIYYHPVIYDLTGFTMERLDRRDLRPTLRNNMEYEIFYVALTVKGLYLLVDRISYPDIQDIIMYMKIYDGSW